MFNFSRLLDERKPLFFLVVFSLISYVSFSQGIVEFRNGTPRETVESHLTFLKNPNYNSLIASYTLGETGFSDSKNEMLIIKLKEILEKKNIVIDDIRDKRRGLVFNDKYELFEDMPEIYLSRIDRAWVYSKETVNAINSIHDDFVLRIEDATENTKQLYQVIEAESEDSIEFSLESPYHTIISHFIYLTDSLFDPTIAARTILFSVNDSSQAESMAVKLNQIFMGTSKRVFDLETMSKDPDYLDSTSQKHIFYPNPKFKQLYLEKVGDDWLYSAATSKLINSVHKEMFAEDAEQIFSFSDRFKRTAGADYRKQFFGIELWQLLMFIFFGILALIVFLVFHFVILKLLQKFLPKNRYIISIYKTFRNATLLVLLSYVSLYSPSFDLQLDKMLVLHNTVNVLLIFVRTLIVIHLINLAKLYMTRKTAVNSKIGMFLFLSLILKIVIFIVAILFIINELGYNLVNVLAGLSIGGFAIALGAQDTVKNFFGSIMIFADRPFAVGDFIQEGNVVGTVEEVGIRTTKIRTSYDSVVSMPNSKLTDNNIDNLGKRVYRRFRSTVILDYKTSSKDIQRFVDKIKSEVDAHPQTRKDFYVVEMHDFTLYGIEILINVFFKVPSWSSEMEARHTFMMKVIDIAADMKIKFAEPPR